MKVIKYRVNVNYTHGYDKWNFTGVWDGVEVVDGVLKLNTFDENKSNAFSLKSFVGIPLIRVHYYEVTLIENQVSEED